MGRTIPPKVRALRNPIPVNRHRAGGESYRWEVYWRIDGREYRRRYVGKMKAEADAQALRNRLFAAGTGALALRPGDAELLTKVRAVIEPLGADLLTVVNEWAERKRREMASVPVEAAIEAFLGAKTAAGARPRYLLDIRSRLSRFRVAFAGRRLSSISSQEVGDWLDSLSVGAITKANFRRVVGVLLNWSSRRGWCERGILADVEKPKIRPAETEFFTPEETRALLAAATRVAPAMVPYLALGLFCGLRTAELDWLPWEHVGEQEVRIEAKTAKTASRRVVPIPPNAAAWLSPHRKQRGPVRPVNARRMLARICRESGVTWKPNAMRHSFASYRLAATNDAPRVSLELGHTSPALVFRHYRAPVSATDAGRYFAIAP